MTDGATGSGLLDQGEAERAAGRMDAAAELFLAALEDCRTLGDIEGWVRAVLGLAATQELGAEPGGIPALLHELHSQLEPGANRARIAAALARSWVFAGEPARAIAFADEALELTKQSDDIPLRSLALNAALLTRSGPDDDVIRATLTTQFLDLAAHSVDPGPVLRAHRWGFEAAAADLDLAAMARHLVVIERIGAMSPRAAFFGSSRRLVMDLVRDKLDSAAALIRMTEDAGAAAKVADAWQTVLMLRGAHAMQSGDDALLRELAPTAEEWTREQGVPAGLATAATWWLVAGEPDRARAVVDVITGPALAKQSRDANWLPTLQQTLLVATQLGADAAVEQAAAMLAPFEDRAVFDVGGAAFFGLTDDSLARAAHLRGDHAEAVRLRDRALAAYRRVGARWWAERLGAAVPDATASTVHLRPATEGVWAVGQAGNPLPAMRGFGYLRTLIERAGEDVPALDLVGTEQGHASVQQHDAGELADAQALAAYRARLADLQEEIDEAREWDDVGRVQLREDERDALLAEISRTTGLGGAMRTSGSSAERARVAVRKAIVHATEKIAAVDAELADHLSAQISTGNVCRYQPTSPPIEWRLA